jgi:enamine deaminase RidA (YjgF/YER057c/UK114 family)
MLSLPPGITLPVPPEPIGAYERGVIRNGIGFVSGQLPLVDGALIHPGRVGIELSEEQGAEAAKVAAMNVLAQIDRMLDGNWSRFAGLLRLDGYVASAENWLRQPTVLNAASEVFVQLLGDKGRHARAAFNVPRLPLNAAVELAVNFAVDS